jgi:hypothetical protein
MTYLMMEMVKTKGVRYEWIPSIVFNTVGMIILCSMLNLMKNYHNFRYNIHKKELFTYGFCIFVFAIFNTFNLFILKDLAVGFFDCFKRHYYSG